MSSLRDTLRAISERLDLPQPHRARILMEVAADLCDLERHFLAQGVSADEARRRAIEHCDLSEEAIAGLVQVHAGGYRRLLERLSAQGRTRWERSFLAVILLFVALVAGRVILTQAFFRAASAFVWPVLLSTLLAVSWLVVKYHAAFLRQDHVSRRLRRGLGVVPGLAALNVTLGVAGLWLGLRITARRIALDADDIATRVTTWLSSASATLVVSLASALVIAILWLFLFHKITRIEESEAAAWLAEQGLQAEDAGPESKRSSP